MADATPATLNRLLSRLDQAIANTKDSRLQDSRYERDRVGTNLNYARSLLLTLERNAASVRVQSQRQPLQADLQKKRAWIKDLNAKLEEYAQSANDKEDDSDRDDENHDDNNHDDDNHDDEDQSIEKDMREFGPAIKDVNAGLEIGEPQGTRLSEPVTNELRARKPLQPSDNRTASLATAREQLFSNRTPEANAKSELQKTETLMSHNRTEQESLVDGLLNLATALKQSSLQFSSSLESEKELLKRAQSGMEQSSLGMEAAERKMGALRSMSEGQGWWGRLKLYGFIFGLWLACFLLVFVGPKLRF